MIVVGCRWRWLFVPATKITKVQAQRLSFLRFMGQNRGINYQRQTMTTNSDKPILGGMINTRSGIMTLTF